MRVLQPGIERTEATREVGGFSGVHG
jgi:hypothetical protein